MKKCRAEVPARRVHPGMSIVLRGVALLMMVVLTFPGRAADERAVKSKVAPVYPEIAKRMKVSGVVKIEAKVDPDGKVTAVKTLSGNRVLSEAAEEAVRQWKYVKAPNETLEMIDINFAPSAQ